MEHSELHPDVVEFIASLLRLEAILAEYGHDFWGQRVRKVRRRAQNSDASCVDLFLRMYGGMGSFNDFYLKAPNSVNDMFHEERSGAYALAKALR